MDDLIRRQDAVEATRCLQTYKLFESDDMLLVDLADVQTTLMMLRSEQQWIPCAERLPEEFKGVLCCTDKEEMFLARVLFDDGNYSFDDEDGMMWEGNVVAWMPLPEPYKGDE